MKFYKFKPGETVTFRFIGFGNRPSKDSDDMTNTAAGRPSIKELESRLGRYINIRVKTRLEALADILEWYEMSVPTARPHFKPEDEIRYQKALRVRTSGLGAGRSDNEREVAYLTVIRLFERVMVRFGVDRPVDTYIAKLEIRRAELGEKESRVKARYGHLVEGLSSVFGKYGIKFELNMDAKTARTFDANKVIYFSTDYAEKLIQDLATHGIFAVAMGEMMPLVCKALSVEMTPDGKPTLSAPKLAENITELSVEMVRFVHANASRIQACTVAVPNVPPPDEDAKIKNIWYRGKTGKIFEFLLECEGATHVNDIRQLVPDVADVTRTLGFIAEKGEETGLWKLTKFRNGHVEFTWLGKK